jgi:hypothetical protein
MNIKRLFFILFIVSLTGPVRADPTADDSGNSLLKACNTYLSGIDKGTQLQQLISSHSVGWCAGLVIGVSQSLYYTGKVCTPTMATQGQGVRVVVKYLEEHPDRLHEDGPILASDALIDAWPCEESQ